MSNIRQTIPYVTGLKPKANYVTGMNSVEGFHACYLIFVDNLRIFGISSVIYLWINHVLWLFLLIQNWTLKFVINSQNIHLTK